MRITAALAGLAALSVVTGMGMVPAQAYDYPVCLRVYGPATYNECNYTSMAQCKASASGRAAECYPNAFAAVPMAPVGRAYRRHGGY